MNQCFIRLKVLSISLILLATVSIQSFAQMHCSIQRYAMIGTSVKGDRIALMLTHFGPASLAPYANLVVYEAGKSKPIFIDGSFLMEGGENELASIATQVFEKNKSNLTELGINFMTPQYSDAQYITLPNSQGIRGQVDIEGYGIKDFQVSSIKGNLCNESNTQTDIVLEKKHISLTPETLIECINGTTQLRSIIRTRFALWFILLKNFDSFGISSYMINVAGLSFLEQVPGEKK